MGLSPGFSNCLVTGRHGHHIPTRPGATFSPFQLYCAPCSRCFQKEDRFLEPVPNAGVSMRAATRTWVVELSQPPINQPQLPLLVVDHDVV